MIFSNVGRFIKEADHKARHHEVRNHDEAVEAATDATKFVMPKL